MKWFPRGPPPQGGSRDYYFSNNGLTHYSNNEPPNHYVGGGNQEWSPGAPKCWTVVALGPSAPQSGNDLRNHLRNHYLGNGKCWAVVALGPSGPQCGNDLRNHLRHHLRNHYLGNGLTNLIPKHRLAMGGSYLPSRELPPYSRIFPRRQPTCLDLPRLA